MVIERKSPNEHHSSAGIVFYPGAQFVSDEIYFKSLQNNADFKSQIDAKLLVIVVPAVKPDPKKPADVKTNLAETIITLPAKDAIDVIKRTVSAVDLKEISKLDKRRDVVAAAEKQIEERQGFMNGLTPPPPPPSSKPMEIGEFE